ncbi:MAG: hypothetical protein J6B00_03225, partial [Alphaproteobacteria bacterium]|nr:hypothetical protein [Alphaproteobacteria bacterium]
MKPIYLKSILQRYDERLNGLSARLKGVSVEAVLKRGFAWVKNTEGQTIYNAVSAKKEDCLIIKFADNELQAKVAADTT